MKRRIARKLIPGLLALALLASIPMAFAGAETLTPVIFCLDWTYRLCSHRKTVRC